MNSNKKTGGATLDVLKRTKILATVGPSTDSYEMIYEMVSTGVDGFRLNFSHGTYEEREQQIKWIRKASKELGRHVAIVQDLQGPKIRLGDFEGVRHVQRGQELVLGYGVEASDATLPVQYDLSKKVKRGDRVFMYDGRVQSVVTSVRDGMIHVRI